MLVKFLGQSMKGYAGIDGNGGHIKLAQGETAEVAENVGKILLTRYGKNFELVLPDEDEKSEVAPQEDKFYRKSKSIRTK